MTMAGIFGPDGKVVDRDALNSVGFSGRGMALPRPYVSGDNKHTPIEHEDGGVAGEVIEDSVGRVSSNVFARTVKVGDC